MKSRHYDAQVPLFMSSPARGTWVEMMKCLQNRRYTAKVVSRTGDVG